MDIIEATASFEDWLGEQIEIVRDDLKHKHKVMRKNEFTFFRATHYRWLQQALEVAPELDGPRVACVGDLHVENFGTWRDREGRHVWGINDLDESEVLPYTLDLARLATSAVLAIADADLKLEARGAHEAILKGYADALADGGDVFVLGSRHHRLAALVVDALKDADRWWADLREELSHVGDAPSGALDALAAVTPAGWSYALHSRLAGVGSLGHRRLVAIGDLDGAAAARELKQLSPPSGRWLGNATSASVVDADTVRSPDPLRAVRSGWLARRIAPDCVKLDLADLKTKGRLRSLFEWMGRETANLHLGTPTALESILADLGSREPDWLTGAATRLANATQHDWQEWKARS